MSKIYFYIFLVAEWIMEKIKIDFNNISTMTIKYNGQKIEITPYISTEDLASISSLCMSHFNNDEKYFENYILIKCIFDMLVLHKCTNIIINGVSEDKKKGVTNILLNIDSKVINEFESSGIANAVIPHIKNYSDCLNQIYQVLSLRNIYNAFNMFGKNLPDADIMANLITDGLNKLSEFKDKDPEMFNQLVDEEKNKQARTNAKNELAKAKSNNYKKQK